MTPETKVAVIGDGEGAYWARLAHLRIVAEIMDRNGGSVRFWRCARIGAATSVRLISKCARKDRGRILRIFVPRQTEGLEGNSGDILLRV